MGVRIIGLGGKMGCGKDTVAGILMPMGYTPASFASRLRVEVAAAILEGSEPAGCPVRFSELETQDVWIKPTPPNLRKLLQWWGTDYRRKRNPEYWVRQLLYQLDSCGRYVISDVRFRNESEAIRDIGGEVWLITGREAPNEGIANHPSEALDFRYDRVVENTGTIGDLRVKCLEGLNLEPGRRQSDTGLEGARHASGS